MKKMYEEYFRVSENGKIREKVFVSRIVVAVIGILVWMSAIGFTAYAYFTSSITSSSNTIEAATYSTEIVIKDASDVEMTPTVDNIDYIYGLGSGTYAVTIKALGNATTGYCKIVVGDVNAETSVKYYTIPMSPDEQQPNNVLTFTIQCYESSDVHIITNWGSCGETDEAKIIASGELITIGTPTTENTEPIVEETTEEIQEISIVVPETSTQTTEEPKEEVEETGNNESSDTSGETTPENPTEEPAEESTDSSDGEENSGGDDTTVPDENISE